MSDVDEEKKDVVPQRDAANKALFSTYGTVLDDNAEGDEGEADEVPTMRERAGSIAETLMEEIQEAAEAIIEGVSDAIEGVTDAIAEEAAEVSEAITELQEPHHGENFFLEMGLVRGLSIMPGDLAEAAEHFDGATVENIIHEEADEEECLMAVGTQEYESLKLQLAEETKSTGVPVSAYFLLIGAVFALSSIGSLLNLQHNVDPIMKVYWRMSGTALFLFPFALQAVIKEGLPSLTKMQVFNLLISAASYATLTAAFVLALKYTAVGNATIFANSQSLILLVSSIFAGNAILLTEAVGAIVAFAGAALCSRDSMGNAASGSMLTLYGDFLAMVSAVAGVWYLVFARTVRPHVNLYVFMFLVMFVGSAIILFCITIFGIEHTFDRNINHGIFGWMNLTANRLPLEIAMVVVCNIMGAMGYIRAMHYFDNLVISVAALLEPIVAELTAAALGVGFLPGPMGWIGNILVLLGTFAVVVPAAGKGDSAAH